MKKNTKFCIGLCLISFLAFSSNLRFAWEFLKNPTQVGAMFECSELVAHELMSFARQNNGPRTFFEVGAGMGSVTKIICRKYLRKDDRLDVVEISPEYCVHLKKLFPRNKYPNVYIHCVDVLKFNSLIKYDYIICTLPFNAFPNGLVKGLQDKLISLSHSGTYMSYVEYMALSYLRRSFTQSKIKAQQLADHKKLVDDFKNRYLIKTEKVYKNLPPIYVHQLVF